jgi:hypothetical protein
VSSLLVEVPVMIGLVNVAFWVFWLQKRIYIGDVSSSSAMPAAAQEACPPDEKLVK